MVAVHKPRGRAVKDAQPRAKKKHEADVGLTHEPPQASHYDKAFTDPVLWKLIDEMFKQRALVRAYNRNQKKIREAFDMMQGVKNNDRIVIHQGDVESVPYIIKAAERSGGNFHIGSWTRIGVGSITKAKS